jgi:hypothetical protein
LSRAGGASFGVADGAVAMALRRNRSNVGRAEIERSDTGRDVSSKRSM